METRKKKYIRKFIGKALDAIFYERKNGLVVIRGKGFIGIFFQSVYLKWTTHNLGGFSGRSWFLCNDFVSTYKFCKATF
jgi:hypothetical protein